MASLLERIEQLGAQGAQPQQRGLEKILRQKTGKARRRTGPAATTLGEQAAITAGREAIREQTFQERLSGVQARGREEALAEEQALQQQQLRQQEQLEQERLAAQAAQTREDIQARERETRAKREATGARQINALNAQAEQTLRDLASQRNVQLNDIFSQYQFEATELEDRRDAAQLEQQAFLLALRDKDYLEQLDRIGRQRQLQGDLQFQDEMERLVLGDRLDNLLKEIDFKTDRSATQRDYLKQLRQIDIDSALEVARANISDGLERNKWESIATGTGGVAEQIGKGKEGAFGSFFSKPTKEEQPGG
jgi:hypothetical protein